MVTYRNETKTAYLGIAPKILKRPGPVSEVVARLMAEGVLTRTPEATLSASVTGHLGPNAPAKLDGVVYIALSVRNVAKSAPVTLTTTVSKLVLAPAFDRQARQKLAAQTVLSLVADFLEIATPLAVADRR